MDNGAVMSSPDWRPVGRSDPARLAEARLQAHHAVQWLARAARAYVPAKSDDSHTNLGWDDTLDGLISHPLKGDTRLGLRLADLTLALHDGETLPQTFALDRRTDREAHDWLRAQMTALGFDADGLDEPSPYALAAHAVAQGAAYSVVALTAEFGELAAWFANAHASLAEIRNRILARGLEPSPLRCWPHHFDLATLTLLEAADPEHARSVNVGFSPGDEHYHEPYFYVSPWPYPAADSLPRLAPVGHWHHRHFTAAIAPANRIVAAGNPKADTEAFLTDAVAGLIAVLR
jgi:hypothetical protein